MSTNITKNTNIIPSINYFLFTNELIFFIIYFNFLMNQTLIKIELELQVNTRVKVFIVKKTY